ncbi:hypothetical protein LCGC14_0861060 [marine sediment metagenome]|uniref:Uncharacterized protein n=1 Tax=marine sediment metagenome TaxID=412755 RepID=A0A0F9RS00_9ZZZZ
MKLKTLKDLIYEGEGDELTSQFIKELKQEAIKWVKDIDLQLKEFEHMQGQVVKNEFVDKVQGLIATREWIKHFFNIIEEDLK